MSKNSIIPFLKDYLINFLTSPFLLDTNDSRNYQIWNSRGNSHHYTLRNLLSIKSYISIMDSLFYWIWNKFSMQFLFIKQIYF